MAETKAELIVTKTRPPQMPPDRVARPRLSRKLFEALKHKLVLVSAPAGYGKTTLVVEALKEYKKPAGWLTLEAEENLPGNFWKYFILALQSIMPGVCGPVFSTLQSPQPPPLEWVLATIINSISNPESDFVLVLDDYHNIDSPAVHQGMNFIIEHLPPRAHLVIVSRADPPLPLARWLVKGEMVEIRASDLSFSGEETAAFMKQTAGIVLSGPDLELLENRTEGWVAGLKMAAFSLKGKQNISAYIRAFSGSNRYVMDYLAEEVLNQQPSGLKQFLLETSILERLCAPLCDAVTERSDSQSLLAHLEATNLFISPLDDERCWYRYHQLFSSILHSRLINDEPQRISLLHQRAAGWFEKEGLIEEAVEHSLQGGDNTRAVALLERIAPRMLGQNRAVKLLEYTSRIPEPLIPARPWLCVFFAWAALTANQPEVLSKMLLRATGALSEVPERVLPNDSTDVKRLKGHILTLQSIIAQAQDDIPLAIRLSEEANRELPSAGTEDLLARAVNSLNLGGYYQKTGDIALSITSLEGLISIGRQLDYQYAVLAGLGSLAEIEMQLSRLDRAAGICREAIEQSERQGSTYRLPVTALSYVVLGQVQYEQNNLDSARENLKKGIELGEAGYFREAVIKGELTMTKLAWAQGDPVSADECIRHAAQLGPWVVVPPEVQQLPVIKAWLALKKSDINAATEWAEQQEKSLPLSRLPGYQQECAYLMLFRVKLASGNCQGLPSYLDKFIQNAESQKRSAAVIEALLLKALVLDCLRDSGAAVDVFDKTLAMAETSGYVRLLVDEGERAAGLLRRMIDAGKHAAYSLKLLDILDRQSSDRLSSRRSMTGVEALSERELEVLRLITSGKSNKEIGSELFLAVGTVKKHINNIFGKLGVESRTRAVARARELGLF